LYYLSANNCVQVSPLCGTFDPNTGTCLTCATAGYQLRNNQKDCVAPTANCATYDAATGICTVCSTSGQNYYLSGD